MFPSITSAFSNNYHIILGAIIGLYVSSFATYTLEPLCTEPLPPLQPQPAFRTPKPPLPVPTPSRTHQKVIRPRYYSTELGIREPLFIGIFTSEEKIDQLLPALNATLQPAKAPTKYFITAQYKLKKQVNLSGLVGFTDTRPRYRPFQVIKYIGDNYAQDYDFYYFSHDFTYTNPYHLKSVTDGISVSQDVYLGRKVPDGTYCSLEGGLLISNSVLRAMRTNLDWCIQHTTGDDYSENFGRCVYHSIGLACQETVEDVALNSYKIRHFDLSTTLNQLVDKQGFNEAGSIYPVLESKDFHLLHAYFTRKRLEVVKAEIGALSEELDDVWPPGQKPGAKPLTRFDLPHQYYFNMTHLYFPDDFTNVRPHTSAELIDLEAVLGEVKLKYKNSAKFEFRRLINGYRTFDLSRGLDYTLDLGFRDLSNGKEVIKRFEVCKPLGKVELITVPYVTENTRITIILPVEEDQLDLGVEFFNAYTREVVERREKAFLMFALLYQANSSAKSPDDKFGPLKALIVKLGSRFRGEEMKVAWVSIRLPQIGAVDVKLVDYPVLNFAVIDLALKKIGTESLVLRLDPFSIFNYDFLNRVRMNTIRNWQIFSPIPFRQYKQQVSKCERFEVNKNCGHFDREEYKFISFYGKDYVNARKSYQEVVPIMRVDNDIEAVLVEPYRAVGNVFEMFVKTSKELHSMRATEFGLKVKYHREEDTNRNNLFLGNKVQLGRILFDFEDKISELKTENII